MTKKRENGKMKQQPKQITSDSYRIICVMCLGTGTLSLNPVGSWFSQAVKPEHQTIGLDDD